MIDSCDYTNDENLNNIASHKEGYSYGKHVVSQPQERNASATG